MKKKFIVKKLFLTLLVTMYTIPHTAEAAKEQHHANDADSRAVMVSQSISQETIQLFQKEEEGKVSFNIAGRTGVYFKIYYSPTDKEESYRLLPGGDGVIGKNGMTSLPLNIEDLNVENIYLKVFTSDNADFSSEVRVSDKPLLVTLKEPKIKLRGKLPKKIPTLSQEHSVGVGTGGVRGALPVEPER